ncbi:MAG: lamin tail domain-containing protein [Chitinophagales bacterium]|nr:lamin tail domain-containing protein [Chitinophagales bacterium]MDW8419742.1 Calx-beta domain-containing protein [Chitinophagales bacterium]
MRKYLLSIGCLCGVLLVRSAVHNITVSNFQFNPASLTIQAGDTVVWNCVSGCHNVNGSTTVYPANPVSFGSGSVACAPWSYMFVFHTAGVYQYQCDPHATTMTGAITVNLPVVLPNVWINEIHYDNTGTDTLEGYEIAGTAGVNLSCFRVHRYSAAGGGITYAIDTLSGIIPNQACGYGAVWFMKAPIQNAVDGLVLAYEPQLTGCGVNHADTILQLLSYEGTFTAGSGRAAGLTFTNIGVAESATTPVGYSLQLGGVGNTYQQFTWQGAQPNTYHAVNNNQYFCGPPQASYRFNVSSKTVSESDGTVLAAYVKASNVALNPQTVQVSIKSGNGNASDINNFTTQTFTFNPGGVDSLPFVVTITDDAINEGTEQIVFVLQNPSHNGLIDPDSLLTLTILDNDVPPPVVQFLTTSSIYSESAGTVMIPVVISNPNANATSVSVSVVGGTAQQGVDYTYTPQVLTFPANSSAPQYISVTLINDALVEQNEFFSLTLNNPTNNAQVGPNASLSFTITDDDGLQIALFPVTQTQFENIGTVNVAVILNNPSPGPVSVQLKFHAPQSTATPGLDFIFQDTTISWAPNTSGGQVITLTVIDDNAYEFTETVQLRLTQATGGAVLTDSVFLLTILNNDPLPTGNCANLFFSEYVEGTGNNKALEIFNPTNQSVDLSNYRIFKSMNGGSSTSTLALQGILAPKSAYVLAHPMAANAITLQADTLTGFLDFNGNDAVALLHLNDTIDIIGQIGVDPGAGWPVSGGTTADNTLVRNRYVYAGEKNWFNAASQWEAKGLDLADSLGTHTMATCGSQPPVPPTIISMVNATQTVAEKDTTVYIIVKSVNPSSQNSVFTVALDFALSTATPGNNSNDFQFTNKVITAYPGTQYDTFPILIFDDYLIEQTEQVVIRFINLGPNVIKDADSVHTTYITDSDVLGVSFLGALLSYTEDAGTVPIKVIRSTATNDTIVVTVTKAPGNATLNKDYVFSDTTLIFYPNSPDTLQAWATILNDTIIETNEEANFDLTITSNNAVYFGATAFTLKIIDDDLPSGLSELADNHRIVVYPNPFDDKLIIRSPITIHQIMLTDCYGRLAFACEPMHSEWTIDTKHLSSGAYLMAIFDAGGWRHMKVIKQ